jgi:hypothetical protein
MKQYKYFGSAAKACFVKSEQENKDLVVIPDSGESGEATTFKVANTPDKEKEYYYTVGPDRVVALHSKYDCVPVGEVNRFKGREYFSPYPEMWE